MRAQTAAFVLHIAVGFAALVLAFYSTPIEPFRPAFLWLVGIPWSIGSLAFYGFPRSRLASTLPMVPLILGLIIWLLAVGVSGLGT